MSLLHLGRVHRQRGCDDEARQAFERALHLADTLETKRLTQSVRSELSELLEQRGDAAAALVHLREAYRLEREVFNEQLESRLHNLQLHFELENAERETELHRLRHVELARANSELLNANASLAQANRQKEALLHALEKKKRQLQRQSIRDALTGLYNRRHFDTELARAIRLAGRHQQPLAVVLCDIDDFKQINDQFSHQVGDEVLRRVARLLAKRSRRTDVVARYGGEEFALLLPATTRQRALAVCEKLRCLVADHPWQEQHPGLRVTLSMGVSATAGQADPGWMMADADEHLYRAKRSGKNQVAG